tara:strand:+ start:386 stop:817 length:432 start_codon:yes stop_codon:yes gene_type:complete
MRISKNKVIQWAEQFDELSYQISEIYDYINQAENKCSEINHLQSDIYHTIDDDELLRNCEDVQDIQDTCDKIDRYAQDTIDEIGNAQYIFNDKCNGINKKLDSLYKDFDDLLKPNVFVRLYRNVRFYIDKLLSYRISLKIVKK